MKLSELSTDQALDVLCELTPYINNIASDKDILSEIGKVEDFKDGITKQGLTIVWIDRISKVIPTLLQTHRPDVYGILSAVNQKSVAEIAAQNSMVTLLQIREVLQDKELIDFFKSFEPQVQTEQSAPSADFRDSE